MAQIFMGFCHSWLTGDGKHNRMNPSEYFFFLQIIPSPAHPPERLLRRRVSGDLPLQRSAADRNGLPSPRETCTQTRRTGPISIRAGTALKIHGVARPYRLFSRGLCGNSRRSEERGLLGARITDGRLKAARSPDG